MLQAGIKDKSYGCHITKWLDKYALRKTKCKGDWLNYAVKVTVKGLFGINIEQSDRDYIST